MVLLCLIAHALAAAPEDLDGLVRVALEQDPELKALEFDAAAAREEGRAARRPMNPMLMLGVDSLGAMPGDPDPTMYMVGVQQMLRGWGEGRATADRALVGVERAAAEHARLEADTRLQLSQAAARIRAMEEELSLLEAQRRAALVLWQAGLRRWGLGAGGPSGPAGMGATAMQEGMEAGPSTAPPTLRNGSRAGGSGMAGMSGMGGDTSGGGGGSSGSPVPAMGAEGADGMGGGMGGGRMGGAGGAGMAGGSGLPELLRVEAEVARLQAEQLGLEARLEGEHAVLLRFVGPEAAEAVRASPGAYLARAARSVSIRPPELDLAAIERNAAEADTRLARSRVVPDVELGASLGIMPDGMVQGVNLMVGVELPVWGANARSAEAAEARVEAASRRAERLHRDLGAAADAAMAAETAAGARARLLREVAVPRARSAWEVTLARYAAGQTGIEEALRAWEGLLAVERDRVGAERDEALRAAETHRVQAP